MGRSRVVPATVPLALAVAAAAILAVALGAPPQELCTSPVRVFQIYNSSGLLTAPTTADALVDGGSSLVGTVQGFNDPLFFAGNEAQIGSMRWLCQEWSANFDTGTPGYYCVYTLKFGPYGSISAVGECWMYEDAEFENAVIGGTGMFRGASGSLNVTTLEKGSRWRYDIYLMQKPNCTTA